MIIYLFALLTLFPLAELMVLLQYHGLMSHMLGPVGGFFVTVITVVLTGVVGAWLARQQGMATLQAIQDALARGELPADAVIDGAFIMVGGALLLTPGFLTDLMGLSLLFPPTRAIVRRIAKEWLRKQFEQGRVYVRANASWSGNPWQAWQAWQGFQVRQVGTPLPDKPEEPPKPQS